MIVPPCYLARKKVEKWENKHCRRVYSRNHEIAIVALTEFSIVTFTIETSSEAVSASIKSVLLGD